MTTRTFVDKNGNTWEWDETKETQKAVERLHKTMKQLKAEDDKLGYDTNGK